MQDGHDSSTDRRREASAPWSSSAGEVLDAVGSSAEGLDEAEARRRLEADGPNQLRGESGISATALALKQFRSPLIYILIVAAGVSAAIGEWVDAAVIAVVLAFNAALGFYQEYRAERSIRELQKLASAPARLVRGGREVDVDAEDIVRGDVVVLEAGDKVPADCRLVEVSSIEADESALTGESVPVAKALDPADEDAPQAERSSMLFMGTAVTRGHGRAVVVATAGDTAIGQIAGAVSDLSRGQTPLQQRVGRLANLIAAVVVVAIVGILGFGALRGDDLDELFLTVVTLAVSAIPEGLPIVLTIALAVGVSRMASRNVIIRRLPAVETLGSCTVIGSDKTGTLTQNRMTVQHIQAGGRSYEVRSGEDGAPRMTLDGDPIDLEGHPELREALVAGALANEARIIDEDGKLAGEGDPTEVALVVAAAAAGLRQPELNHAHPRWGEIPFDSERQYQATFHEHEGRDIVFVKGSPERVAELCGDGEGVLERAGEMASRGLRVLAVASRDMGEAGGHEATEGALTGLQLLGLQGLIDPPREDVREALDEARAAGVRVVMITGDHAATAHAIARDLGIVGEESDREEAVLTGRDMAGLSEPELAEAVRRKQVYARVSPEQKLSLVKALHRQGEVVAVTGDGVNDAPALKAADIGVAMGSGTEVAREAAEMVISDDHFASVVAAVAEGRFAFDNIRKVTFFLVSSGVAEVIAVTASIAFAFSSPFLPVQILWLNLVTNGVQDKALAFEPGERELMRRPPRPTGEGLLSRLLYERTVIAGVWMALGTLLMFGYVLENSSLEEARTAALTTMVAFQVFHAYNARSEFRSVLRKPLKTNTFLLLGSLAAVLLHLGAMYLAPGQALLDLEPLGLTTLLQIVAVGSTIVLVMEAHKALRNRELWWGARACAKGG